MKYIVVKMSSYDSINGYREWFEFQPQYDKNNIYINLENIFG